MIDEEKTFERFGYVSTDWADKSDKKIVVVCDRCGAIRYIRKNTYRPLCRSCSLWKGGKILHVCEMCGKEYMAYESEKRRFCSIKCVGEHNSIYKVGEKSPRWNGGQIHKVCAMCGKTYLVDNARSETAMFCSCECHGVWLSKNNVGENNYNWAGGKIVKLCECCGKEYYVDKYLEHKSRFCSKECGNNWKSVHNNGENNPRWTGGKTSHVCELCGKEFFAYARLGQRFCSFECSNIGKSGENSPNWIGGSSFEPYCEKFNNIFKDMIREKFGRVCFICGKTEEYNGQKMSVHHVSYQKDCLCDGVVCDFVPLCRSCHTRTNGNRFFWEKVITYALRYYDDYYNVEIPKGLLRLNI